MMSKREGGREEIFGGKNVTGMKKMAAEIRSREYL